MGRLELSFDSYAAALLQHSQVRNGADKKARVAARREERRKRIALRHASEPINESSGVPMREIWLHDSSARKTALNHAAALMITVWSKVGIPPAEVDALAEKFLGDDACRKVQVGRIETAVEADSVPLIEVFSAV